MTAGSLELEACWFESPSWRTFVLMKPRRELLLAHRAFEAWVAGLHYRGDDPQSPAFAPGARLRLVPEPKNPFDPHAVAVRSADGELQTGYLVKAIAGELHDVTEPRCAIALGELLEDGRRFGILVLVSREDVDLRVRDECDPDAADRARGLEAAGRRYYAAVMAARAPVDAGDPVEAMARMLKELEGP